MGGAVFLSCWLFGLRHPTTEVYRLLDTDNGSLWEGLWQCVLPRITTASVFVPTLSHNHPLALQETLQY